MLINFIKIIDNFISISPGLEPKNFPVFYFFSIFKTLNNHKHLNNVPTLNFPDSLEFFD